MRHIVRDERFFLEMKEKSIGEQREYMGNDTYSDVLREGKCKRYINGSLVILSDTCT